MRPPQAESTTSPRSGWVLLLLLLVMATAVRLPGLFGRSIWYDEAISLLIASDQAIPDWPREPVPAGEVKSFLQGTSSFSKVLEDVRRTDVHPALYYYGLSLWKSTFGHSIETARLFSLVASLLALLAFHAWVRASGIRHPWGLSLAFALSTGAVHGGHEARAYALASWLLLMGTYLALRASQRARASGDHVFLLATGAAFLTALTFHINYLTLFSTAAVLGWLTIQLWPRARGALFSALAMALLVGLSALPTLLPQLDARPEQLSGFSSFGHSLRNLLLMSLEMVGIPAPAESGPRQFLAIAIFLGAIALTLFEVRRDSDRQEGAWSLVLALALAPLAGLLLLDLAFDKQLHVSRYLTFAGPGLVILVAYGMLEWSLRPSRRWLGRTLFLGLLALQFSNLNWAGFALCPNHQFGGSARTTAARIAQTSAPSKVVTVALGAGRGGPGSILAELDPLTPVVFFDLRTDFDQLLRDVEPYDDLWVYFSVDSVTLEAENRWLKSLEQSGRYGGLFRDEISLHLRKTP